MDTLKEELAKLEKKGSLGKSIEDIQNTIDILVKARDSIAGNPDNATTTLAKLQNPVKQSFEAINLDLKGVHKALSNYGKALDNKFKDKPLPTTDYDALSAHPTLINRAVAMHLLREGQFSVASTFLEDATRRPPRSERNTGEDVIMTMDGANDDESGVALLKSEELRKQFADMYHILNAMKNEKNLLPAIEWAKAHSAALETRGSNLEFELGKTQFVWLFNGAGSPRDLSNRYQSRQNALRYGRENLARFQKRYLPELQQLMGAMPFYSNMAGSPYRRTFLNDGQWDDLVHSFTREFCSLLGLSADSPLFIAATAGAIALPTLLKLQNIVKKKGAEWSSKNELPVEIPLPPSYQFHSIFICPVSKAQSTDQNPPMMMPCGHVIANESMDQLSKGNRFKCPYCPSESRPEDAKKLYL